ncbi:MAG TPA: helix-turn-helix domain-containing protein [Gaiellaceae bacterium]
MPYAEWSPTAWLADRIACTWTSSVPAGEPPRESVVLPDACMDLIWDGSRLFVAGPDVSAVAVVQPPGSRLVGIRFRPGAAPGFLGAPASEFVDEDIALADLRRTDAHELEERLHAATSVEVARATLERAVARTDPIDPAVGAVVRLLARGRCEPLADSIGLSERQLRRRCTAALGYGPKTLERIVRLRRFLRLAEARPEDGLAYLAALAGYADQAHLTRECVRLAGATPRALRERGGRIVQDGLVPAA